jgi:hypothetical protein
MKLLQVAVCSWLSSQLEHPTAGVEQTLTDRRLQLPERISATRLL